MVGDVWSVRSEDPELERRIRAALEDEISSSSSSMLPKSTSASHDALLPTSYSSSGWDLGKAPSFFSPTSATLVSEDDGYGEW
jgi:hypothetical protein